MLGVCLIQTTVGELTFLSALLPSPLILSSCPYLTTWKLSTCTPWQTPQHQPSLRMVCLCNGKFPIDAAGSLDAPTSFLGSTCTNCTGCSEQQETETLNIGRSWCGEEWMQILTEQRRRGRRKGRRDRLRQDSPRPWWGSESERGIKQGSEWKDTETTSGSEHQDISGLRSLCPTTPLRMRRPTQRQVQENSCCPLKRTSQRTKIHSNPPHGGWVWQGRTVPGTLNATFTASSTES